MFFARNPDHPVNPVKQGCNSSLSPICQLPTPICQFAICNLPMKIVLD
jgi:hypothetical protein